MNKFNRILTGIFFLAFIHTAAFSQVQVLAKELLKLKSASDNSNENYAAERLYLQFDKPFYTVGDTIWYKAYLFNAAYITPSAKSDVLYIEIANDSNKVIKQYRLLVYKGLGWGDIALDDKEFKAGTYTIRAYTNWMRNFGEACFFNKRFYVTGSNGNNWLVKINASTVASSSAGFADVKLQFSDMDNKPIILEPLDIKVNKEGKNLFKQKLKTDLSGLVNIKFAPPQNASGLTIVAENDKKDRKMVIPVELNRPENTDLQFLPEGGNLVAGIAANIAFKAIAENGKGTDISGVIVDRNQKQVAAFQSLHNGMGSFFLSARAGEKYLARVTFAGGVTKDYPLPEVINAGTVLQVKNPIKSDSVTVSAWAAEDKAKLPDSLFLIGQARGIICYAAIITFRNSNYLKRTIAKRLFPSGITRFILMTTERQVLNERLVYIDHNDNLTIRVKTDQAIYRLRDSVSLQLAITDNTGSPVAGNFSLAVTDDEQVKTDTLNSDNVITHLLLTSDLKGYVEEPGYYLSPKTADRWQAMDNLLLTQGWVSYNWRQLFSQTAVRYDEEHEFVVKGKVTNAFNKPLANTNIILLSRKPSFLIDTVTNSVGRFTFKNIPPSDTAIYFIQARNKGGKSFNVGINIDELPLPIFTKPSGPLQLPWYINSDATLLDYTKNNAFIKQREYLPTGGHRLKEVKITAHKIIKGSQNLNGAGNADIVIDEKELEKAGKKTFLELFQEKVPGFREGSSMGIISYFIKYKSVFIIVDGIELSFFVNVGDIREMRRYLQNNSAEDIKGIEVNFSNKYVVNYERRFNFHPSETVFIEITTRSGHGPMIYNTIGRYLYKPLPFSPPGRFYKPKYAVKDTAGHALDLRSTINWEPNVITDKNGQATVSFYAADKPSSYTIIIEGTDMNGNLGYKTGKIIVGKPKEKAK